MVMPLDFSVPIEPNQSGPPEMMLGTEAIDSTLLITVGLAYRPATAGKGGRSRGWPRRPSSESRQGGLLAADVRTRAGVHDDLQAVAGVHDVRPGVAGLIRLGNCLPKPADHVQHLATDIDEGVVRPDRVRGDDHTLDQRVRRGQHQRDVLAGAGLGLVGVDHQVLGLRVVLRDEAPLHSGGEACTAAAPQAGVLDQGDNLGRLHLEGGTQGVVPATPFVVGHLPGALVCPVGRQDRCQKTAS
jgi:hypothetical protein